MDNEEYIEIKDMFVDHVKNYMTNTGGMQPHITVYAKYKKDDDSELSGRNGIIHIPIPGEYFESEDKKDEFMDNVMPSISKQIKTKFLVQAVGWASEAWMRTADKKDNLSNYKKLPIKKEILIITLESEKHNDFITFEIIRKGKKVNEDGDLVDDVELLEMTDLNTSGEAKIGGRFSGLYDMIKT